MNYRNDGSGSGGAAGDRSSCGTSRAQRAEVCIQFMDKLQQLQETGHMCDLIFELRGQQFYAHRVVMSAWSPLIYSLCSKDSTEAEKIRVQYDNLEVFGSFLAFLYTGQMDAVAEENLIQVLHLATSLQVNGLRQTCEEALKHQLHIGNIISTFHVARKFRLPNLEEFALSFMQMNLPEAVKQVDFLSLTPSRFNSFLSSGWVCVMKPEVKLFLIISWLGYDVKERQQYLVLLLKYIDWSTVANDFLLEISQTENFFTTNESSLYLLLQTLFSAMIPLGPYSDLFPGLREKYGYLLDHIVQNSYVLPLEPEEYFPVTFFVANQSTSDAQSVGISGNGPTNRWGSDQREQFTEAEEYSNDGDNADPDDFSDGDDCGEETNFTLNDVSKAMLSTDKSPTKNKAVAHRSPLRVRGGRSKVSKVSASPDSGSTKRKRVHPQKLDQSSSPFTASPKWTPQKVDTVSNGKRRGPVRLKYKECQKSEAKQNSVESIDAKKTKDTSASVDSTHESTTLKTPLRSKRKAAAKFSVPEKLMPRRKTKAALKEPAAKKPPQSKINQKVIEKDDNVSDKDDDDDYVGKGFDEPDDDDGRDPDYGKRVAVIPAARARAKQGNREQPKLQQTAKESTKDQDIPSTEQQATNKQVTQQQRRDADSPETPPKHGKITKNKCDECDFVAPSATRLQRHKQYVHGGVTTQFTCNLCKFECRWNKKYYTHMRQHFEGPPFACDKEGCGFTAEKIQLLLMHRRKHTNERPYKCDVCSASFRTRNNLYAHRKCHSDDKNYECPECHRRFKMKNTLEQHLVTHSDLRPYLCDTCGFSTKFQSHLIAHKRIHTGDVFHCSFPMCLYYSPKRSQLKAHMRSHLNIRHHQCNICTKSFVEKSHLIRHMKIHQEDRPFRCEKCDYSSTRVDKLREHVNKHHSKEASAKRKWTPRKKKGSKSSSATRHPTSTASRKTRTATAASVPARDSMWVSSMEASIATLVSAAEEVRLASQSPMEMEGREGEGDSVHLQAAVGVGTQEGIAVSEMGDYGMRQVEYVPHSYKHQTMAAPSPAVRDIGAGHVMIINAPRSAPSTCITTSSPAPESQQVTYEVLQQHRQPSQSQLRPILPQHTSATLLQQLAMSVSNSSSMVQRPGLQPTLLSGDPNLNPTLLPHAASADVAAASQILLSAMQQHATASAADSLASLSYGLPPSVLHGQGEGGSHMHQQVMHSSDLPSLALMQAPHQQHHQAQPHVQNSDGQHQDYSGLNAFMALL